MDAGGDVEDGDRTRLELREAQSEVERLRQQSHERKLTLDQQLLMVDALTSECVALQAENNDLRRKQLLQEEVVRGLSRKLSGGAQCDSEEDDVSPVSVDAFKLQEDVSLLNIENKSLSEELALLKGQCSTREADIKRLQGKNKNLEDLVSESYLEIATLKEALRCAKDECASLEDRVASMRADYGHNVEVLSETRDALAQALADLHVARAPAMLERGSSIFSELEDSRAMLLQRYQDLKAKYGALAKRCNAQARDMSKLRSDKLSVLRLVEDSRAEEDRETTELVRALETRVADLERANKQLISELQVPVRVMTEVDSGALKYLETVTAEAREQVCSLRRELDDQSLVLLMNQRLLNARQAELRLYHAENLRLKSALSDAKLRQQQVLSEDGSDDEKSQVGAGDPKLGQGDVAPRAAVHFQACSQQQGPTDNQDGHDPITKPGAKKPYPKLVMRHKKN